MTNDGKGQNNDNNENKSNSNNDNNGGATFTNPTPPATDVNALLVKLPIFWSSNPSTWFIQAEAQFSLGKITADISKYNYVVATLPQDIAESVSDILEKPPRTDLYDNLKKNLIERHTLSLETRIKKLVSDEEMGDKRPSEYFRTLQRLAGNCGTVGDELLKKLWLSRLPQTVSVALIPQKDGELTDLLKLADQVWEAIKTANISAVQSQSSSSNHNELRSEINELKLMIEKISFDRSRSRDRSRNSSRSNSRSYSRNNYRSRSRGRRNFDPNGKFCFNHFKYGKRAKDCKQPCAFINRSQRPNNSSNSSNNNSNNPN